MASWDHSRFAAPAVGEDLRAHIVWLRRLAGAVAGGTADGEDAVGETLAAAVERPPADRGALRPWLGKVLRNFVRLRARGERNRGRREEVAAALDERRIPTPEELLARHEALSLLAAEVRRLEEPFRSTVLLCYAEDLAPAEIARRQGVPAGTVRWRLKRGLDEIRRRLDERHPDRAWAMTLGLKGAVLMKASSKGALVAAGILLALAGGLSLSVWRSGPPADPTVGAGALATKRPPPRRFGHDPAAEDGAPAVTIDGTVRDTAGGAIAGATVAVGPAAASGAASAGRGPPRLVGVAVTGAGGQFRLSAIPSGAYRLTASAPGFLPGFEDLVAAPAVAPVEIRLARGGHTLAGRVLDTGGGAIAGARLRVWIDGGWTGSISRPMALARTDGDGAYAVTLPAGTHMFLVEADGYASQRAPVVVAGAQKRDFRLHPASAIAGWVFRRGTRDAVAGARVRADSHGYFAEADAGADGSFTITDLEPGDYRLHALAPPLAGASARPVTVGLAARVEGVVLEVERGYTVSGKLRRPGGPPVPGVRVALREWLAFEGRGAGILRGEARTGDDGAYRLEAVLPGAYSVAAEERSGPASRRVTVAAADVGGVDLELTDSATVRGRVTDQRDRPVAGALVRAQVAPNEVSAAVHTDADGRFLVENVLPGPLTVTASHSDRGSGFTEAGPLRPSEDRQVLVRLGRPGAHIRGRVLWDDGSPAAGLVVQAGTIGAPGSAAAATDRDGRYSLGPFDVGWLVVVSVEQAAAWNRGQPDTDVSRPIRIKTLDDVSGVDFRLPRPDARLAGVVLDPDGKPLGGSVVSTEPGPAGTRVVTAEDGRFVVDGLLRGKYLVRAQHPGLPTAEVPDVPAGTDNLRIRIERGGTLGGRVVHADGARVGPFSIFARPAAPATRRGPPALADPPQPVAHRWVPAGDGAFEIGGLAPGAYDLVVTTLAGASGGLPAIPVRAGQARGDLTVEVNAGMTLVGRVVDVDTRAPLPRARVRASSERGSVEAETDAAGTFRLEGVMRGVRNGLQLELAGYLPYGREWTAPLARATLDLGTLPLLAARYGEKRTGPVGRVGLTFTQDNDGQIVVRNAPPGSPAGQAGLKPGDVILSVDRRDVRNADMGSFVHLVAGKPGDPIVFEVRSPGAPPRTITVVRM